MTTTIGLVVTNYVGVTMQAPAARKIATKASAHGAVVFGSESDYLPDDAYQAPSWRLAHSEADNGRDGSSLAVRRDRVRIDGPVTRHPLISAPQARRAGMNVRYALVAHLLIDDWYELCAASVHLPLKSTGLQSTAIRALRDLDVDLFAGDLNMLASDALRAFPNRTVRGRERLHVVARPGVKLHTSQRLSLPPSDHPGVRVGLVIPNRPQEVDTKH